ncbi:MULTISPECIES: TetR/AcrR family transcriptional regulator [Ponticaulis]|uniref:TetR/AcrR family transcriptional regulator n=1 Tax=Ponticaulis TaxID=1123044 RepID=UPI0003B5D52D|nr:MULTISPECIES: TetR/AcrR family transcriptional regulator [Ponticaulis]RPG18518.1 MAG: TetR/AcrR family transcriptional regulator [Hyphomonadaceae bacterium TMED125]HBJ93995.1 TetR/AcrR family transcriptional regulator [Hyphomonadaceae bacterium]MAF56518.1 TetR/AcrR family transcriptional regulator [Ponticaulis sp.]MAJ09906.1 TetR/AcrR family transcriptional regulator [Ponticaulis sp.]MBN05691.1 TetR/AcrR family transcriptional regulator [Ponticaulis sp.]|tara:strand:+ start:22383 stop:23024 length:642 start_codon:yes stop_codon:yes gene_type:complete
MMISKTQGKRERSKAANREAILDAARLVFAELGYETTTVRDIIRRTDLASGTFYNYFKSKEEIFEALAETSAAEFGRLLRTLPRENISFEEYLKCAFSAYFHFIVERHAEVLRLAAPKIHISDVRSDTPEMNAIFQEIRKDIETILASEGSPDIDTAYLTASAIGIARELGDVMLTRISNDQDQTEKLVEQATDFATNLILCGIRHAFDEIRT